MDVFLSQMWVVWRERPTGEARELLAARVRLREDRLGADNVVSLLLRLMVIALEEFAVDGARAEIAACLALLATSGLQFIHAVAIAGMLASPVAQLGDQDDVLALYDLLLPVAGGNYQMTGAVAFLGAYDYHLALLATALLRWGDAERHFEGAAAMHERMGAKAFLARTRLEWAEMLAARKRREDGERIRELLDLALATARELGLPNVERRTVALLARSPTMLSPPAP
jgi:hypothetical protein